MNRQRRPGMPDKMTHVGTSKVTRTAASQLRMGDFNQTVILDAIRRSRGGISRVELSEVTGLSAQSLTTIARQLIAAGLVREGSREPAIGRGKPRTLIRLDPEGQFAVGVHLDPAVITYVLLDLTGRTIAHVRRPTPKTAAPKPIIKRMAMEIDRLVEVSGIDRTRLVGVGIAAPGPIDIDRGIVVDPPNLDGWRHVPLRDALREAVGLPVLLDKDVTAAAAAQKWSSQGQADSADFCFFYLGTGVGAGVVLHGEVVRGASYNVGEIGHFIADADGPDCECGKRGCIGESSQPRYLVQQGVAAGVLEPVDPTDRQGLEQAVQLLLAAATEGDSAAQGVVGTLVTRIISVAADLANLLDLELVIFGGPRWVGLEPFFDAQRAHDLDRLFAARKIHRLALAGTDLGADVGAVGAATLVLDHTFSTNPAVLLIGRS